MAGGAVAGVDNVPETRQWFGPFGEGTLQEYVEGEPASLDLRSLQAQQLAVIDYILAQLSRHEFNELFVMQDGQVRAVAIDNEDTLFRAGIDAREHAISSCSG